MGVVNTTYTFSGTDTITSSKLNNIIDDTTFTSDAIQGTTLQVVSPGKLAVSAGGITSNEIASNSVVTAKILDSNVTTAKIADSNVTTAKIADSNVTTAKIADSNVTTAKIADSNVTTAKIADSNVTTAKIADASITAAKLNGAQTGSAPIFGCRAYGSFNGQATSPISPIASGNVSTIVRTGTGIYRITMTTSMSSSNYTVVTSATHAVADTYGTSCDISIVSESQFDIITGKITGGTTYNSQNVNFAVFQ
jgi:hypothetical protein